MSRLKLRLSLGLLALAASSFLSCQGAPAPSAQLELPPKPEVPATPMAEESGLSELSADDGGDAGNEGWPQEEADEPSLALPPDPPHDGGPMELREPFWEYGEAFLPEQPPEEADLALAVPLPEPTAPDLPPLEPPVIVEAPVPSEPPPEPVPPVLVEAPVPEAPPTPSEQPVPPVSAQPPEPVAPPPPRVVSPAEPAPSPPPAREALPLPANPVPELPARAAPSFAPSPVPAPPSGVSSRLVRATVGQTVEVPFRGAGWVYLGESASKRGISYSTRRLESEGQTFVFRANETGAYELQFYRQDFIRDYIVNDLVTVLVEEAPQAASSFGAPMDRGVAVAEPRWPTASAALAGESEAGAGTTMGTLPAVSATPDTAGSSVAVAGAASSPVPPGAAPSAPAAAPGTAAAGSPLALPAETPEGEYLRRAREEYGADHVPQALAILDQFQARFPRGSDEAYWLYAQLYEKLGPARDISLALDYYRRLVNEYPQSSRHGDARRRIAYLERYYINIQ